MYSSCSGSAGPNWDSSKVPESLSESDGDTGGVPGIKLA